MKWVVFNFKTADESWHKEASEIYIKKIKHFLPLEIQTLKTTKANREDFEVKKRFEEKILLEKLSNDDFVILLDEKGKKLGSLEFSKMIERAQASSKKRGVLIIGGAFGVSDIIKKRSDCTLCLSDLTMNHLVAEVVLLEQFYRALTILNRIPYHNT